ncbi:MAG TPA: zinc ribbon domain-containing protein [Patescibacteria group bacterium]|nr:zinc ribbon domain-containing protein [Patescibacteria group bacterium]
MPLYEYTCRKCSKRFELLVFGSEKAACPKCHGRDLERLFSTFAVSGAARKSDSDSFGDLGGSDFAGGADPGGGDDFAGGFGGGAGGLGDLGGGDLGGGDPGAGDDAAGSGPWDDD